MTPTFASLLMTLSMNAFAAEPALVSAYLGAIDEVTYPKEGTSLVFAFVDPAGPLCADRGSAVEIAATFQGGITGPFNTVVGAPQLPGINIIGKRGRSWAPGGFDDVTDQDNHLVVCVPSWVDPVTLEVDAGTLFDPGNNPNPPTSVPVEAR